MGGRVAQMQDGRQDRNRPLVRANGSVADTSKGELPVPTEACYRPTWRRGLGTWTP